LSSRLKSQDLSFIGSKILAAFIKKKIYHFRGHAPAFPTKSFLGRLHYTVCASMKTDGRDCKSTTFSQLILYLFRFPMPRIIIAFLYAIFHYFRKTCQVCSICT
jgi:hypothetical protein